MAMRDTVSMETIKIQVPSELAQRLQPYQDDLPRILEWGLRCVEGEIEKEDDLLKAAQAEGLATENPNNHPG